MIRKWFIFFAIILSTHLSAEENVLVFAGSTQTNSINKQLAAEAATIAKERGAHVTLIDLKNYFIPFYDADLEKQEGMPPKAKELRQMMLKSHLIVIASPEYNGSLSAVLKNVIDWASRDESGNGSRDAFKGKKFILLSASPGQSGGARGLVHLRNILENLGGTVIPDQLTVSDAYNAFDSQGHLKNPQIKKQLTELIQSNLKN